MQKIEILRPFRYAALDEVHPVAYEPGAVEVKDEVAGFALEQKLARSFKEKKPAASAPAPAKEPAPKPDPAPEKDPAPEDAGKAASSS